MLIVYLPVPNNSVAAKMKEFPARHCDQFLWRSSDTGEDGRVLLTPRRSAFRGIRRSTLADWSHVASPSKPSVRGWSGLPRRTCACARTAGCPRAAGGRPALDSPSVHDVAALA